MEVILSKTSHCFIETSIDQKIRTLNVFYGVWAIV